MVIVFVIVEVGGCNQSLHTMLDDFVFFLLDHLVFHADDFVVGLLKLS